MSNKILSQVKFICSNYDIKPLKTKGQNFLVDQDVLDKIVSTANFSTSDTILEVGPGLGILTEELTKKAKKVVGVEIDQKLFDFLKLKFKGVKNLELINGDVMKLPATSYQLPVYKIVANIPYNITSHFLKKFLTSDNKPKEMTLLIQKEVAQRICAQPGQMSLLSVSVQLYGKPEIISTVSKKSFWPSPAVDSAILKISKIRTKQQVDQSLVGITEKQFWQVAKVGFSAKRKQLQNNLAAGLKISSTEIKNILKEANFNSKIRAQNLSIDDWSSLAKSLKSYLN